MVVVRVETDLLNIESLRSVNVGHRDEDDFDLPVGRGTVVCVVLCHDTRL
jgi:hypothetical protein